MAPESPSSSAFDFTARVARAYASLVEALPAHTETGLGGKLFYAGELDEEGRALLVAANISGAGTLAATDDRAEQKKALRDGVADFVVTNLDEALRILKNQLRKRETVAVCVALSAAEIESEMGERGVAPDLVRGEIEPVARQEFSSRENGEETESDLSMVQAIVTWQTGLSLPKDLNVLDQIALTCLEDEDWRSRRWLRLSPRYLGRLAHGLRLIESNRKFSARFFSQLDARTDRGEIDFAFEVSSFFRGTHDQFRYDPTRS